MGMRTTAKSKHTKQDVFIVICLLASVAGAGIRLLRLSGIRPGRGRVLPKAQPLEMRFFTT